MGTSTSGTAEGEAALARRVANGAWREGFRYSDFPYRLEALLKHRRPMLLLDKVIGYDDDILVASVTITESTLFLIAQGVFVARR